MKGGINRFRAEETNADQKSAKVKKRDARYERPAFSFEFTILVLQTAGPPGRRQNATTSWDYCATNPPSTAIG